jgi:hypothetical protein
MKNSKYLLFPAFFLIFSCSNNSEDDLTNPVMTLNTTKYIQDVKPIIDNNCIFCHGSTPSNGAPMSLVTYAQVKDAVQNRGLLDRISRTQGAPGMMPNQGTRLPQSTIDLIIDWNTDGLLE